MKKKLTIVMVAILTLSLVVVGCSSGQQATQEQEEQQQTDQSGSQEKQETEEQKPDGLDKQEVPEEVTIKFWEKEAPEIDEATLDVLIDKFEEKYPKVTVERTHMGIEDLRQKTQTAYMGGKGPDVVWSPFDHVGPFSAMGIAQPLDDLMSDELKQRYIDSALPGMSLQGKNYGVPVTMGNHLMLMYNKDLVDEAPDTWEQLIKVAKKKTKDKDGDGKVDQYGLAYNLNEPFWWASFYGGFDGWFFNKDQEPTLDNQAAEDAMRFVKDLKFKHEIVPKEASYDLADSLFKKGKSAFLINGVWSLSAYEDAKKVDLGVSVLPKFKKSGKYSQPVTSGAGLIMISDRPKAKQIAVMKFIDFLTNQESQKKFVKKHKRLPSNKQVYDLPVIKNDPLMKTSGEQLRKGKPMPVIPEMRAIWDSIRPALQSVMAGDLAPSEAPAKMQKSAEKKVKDMQ